MGSDTLRKMLGVLNDIQDCDDMIRNNGESIRDAEYILSAIDTMIQRLILIRKEAHFGLKTDCNADEVFNEIISLVDGHSNQLHGWIDDNGQRVDRTQDEIEFIQRWKPY